MENPILLKRESNFYNPFMMEKCMHAHIRRIKSRKKFKHYQTPPTEKCITRKKETFCYDVLRRRRVLKIKPFSKPFF